MKKKPQNNKLEKINIATISLNKKEEDKKEDKKTDKKTITKAKSTNRSIKKLFEDDKKVKQTSPEQKTEKKYITFNLDFVFRRERYTLKNLLSNYLISKVKKLISKKISVEMELIHIYYLDKEITNDKLNVYNLIKDNKIKYFEIKKESPINENIISLNANVNLIYKVKCKNIQNAKDFIDKIDIFFREKCLDKHYLCEPVEVNTYEVGFACEDNCYQFKRYMSIVKRLDSNYANTSYEYVPFDKNKFLKPKLTNFPTLSTNISEPLFINKGPYMTYEDIQRENEKEGRKKWINKKGFVYKNVKKK